MTRLSSIWLVGLGLGCSSSSAPGTLGFDEPLRVKVRVRGELVDAQFQSGLLPGTEPLAGRRPEGGIAGSVAGDVGPAERADFPPRTGRDRPRRARDTRQLFGGREIRRARQRLLGDSRFRSRLDPANNDEQLWAAVLEFSSKLPPGVQRLALAAVDAQSLSGPQRLERLCVAPRVPDNLNACDPTLAPPSLVLSLAWDRDVDLDLRVLTPDGEFVEPKSPTTALKVDGSVPDAGTRRSLDRERSTRIRIAVA